MSHALAQVYGDLRRTYQRLHRSPIVWLLLLPAMPLYWVNSFMFYASHQAFEALARGSEQAVGGSWAANPLITVLIKLYRYSFTLFGWDLADESLTRWIERYHRATGRIAIVLAMIMEATVALAVWSLVMSHLQVN